jgi:hypothetical protein
LPVVPTTWFIWAALPGWGATATPISSPGWLDVYVKKSPKL